MALLFLENRSSKTLWLGQDHNRVAAQECSQKASFLVMEINYGPFESILELPHGYDLGQAKASYLNGFLRIEVPPVTPAPHPKSTKLPISDGK